MHIVQALVSFNLGGSELVATELSEYAASKGHRVSVIAANGPLGIRVRACGAEHLDWPIGKKQPPSVARIDAFGLRESMHKTLDVYYQAITDKNT